MQPPRLDGYVVGDLIGYGPTGQVWRACAEGSDQPLVVKRLRPESLAALDRLRRNAHLANRYGGGHVVRTIDVLEAEATVLVVAEFIAGDSLETLLARRDRLDPAEVITLLAPLAQTLGNLADAGLAHGALTPSNILLTADGRPLLSDVGVAVAMGAPPTDDVIALARIGLDACSDGRPHSLVDRLRRAVEPSESGGGSAAELAAAILASGPATPIRRSARAVAPPSALLPGERTTRPARAPASAQAPPPRTAAPRAPRGRLPVERPVSTEMPTAQPTGSRRRVIALVAAAATALVATAGIEVRGHRPSRSSEATPRSMPTAPAPRGDGGSGVVSSRGDSQDRTSSDWRDVVQHLEDVRAAAFERAKPGLLAGVYAPTSRDLARDRARVAALAARGLHAAHFTAAVSSVVLVRLSGHRTTLRVTDRLSSYSLVRADGTVVRRGAARPARTFELELARTSAGWRVARVAPVPQNIEASASSSSG